MQKLVMALLVGSIALAPAIAAAQTSSGSKPGSSGSSSTSGTAGSTGASSGGGTATTPGASGGSSTTPSASPSGSSSDLSQYMTKADCEKAGGMWQVASNKCVKK
jgi:hypothetical protein